MGDGGHGTHTVDGEITEVRDPLRTDSDCVPAAVTEEGVLKTVFLCRTDNGVILGDTHCFLFPAAFGVVVCGSSFAQLV